ncbi:hypothetical protein V1517DRAFT_333821 [Lipomyces orientalis]|uniref:Uncharacterized protein n=1 Tax=Lipomyces orientalis TaxID=1233043 RepID=A0ACC3TDK5_9ASCO
MEMVTTAHSQRQMVQMQQLSHSPLRRPQHTQSESSISATAPFAYTSKFRVIESSVGRNWTDADILTLIESYKECKRHEIAAREATAASVYATNTRIASPNSSNPVASTAAAMNAALEKPETAEAFFEKVHSVFVKFAMNPQRTAKSLHEKFGFLTVTYRRIKDFQTGKLFGAPAGVSWWEIPVKEQRRYLSKSMTPISDVVYKALEPLIERSDFQKRAYSIIQSRIQPAPATTATSTFAAPDAPLMNIFRVSVAPTPTQRSPGQSQPQSPASVAQTQSIPVVAEAISDTSIPNRISAQVPQSARDSNDIIRQDLESQQDNVYMQPQYGHQPSGASTRTETNHPVPPSGALQQAGDRQIHTPPEFSSSQQQHQQQAGNNPPGHYFQQMPIVFDPASVPPPPNPPPNLQQRQNNGHQRGPSTIQRQAMRHADGISGNLDRATTEVVKRRRVDYVATVPEEDEHEYREEDIDSADAYPPPVDPPPGVIANQQQQLPRQTGSAAGILREFVTMYKQSLDEQRRRDEQLLLTLQGISQMTTAICKAVEQGRVHSNSSES